MKMWICRDKKGGRLTLHSEPPIWFESFGAWCKGYMSDLPREEYPEVTFLNSPQEVELKIKHNEMRLSPMFRLFDRIVIKDPSDRKRIVKYTEKLIDKLKEEGFYADAKCAEEYLKVFNGELVELVIKKKEQD